MVSVLQGMQPASTTSRWSIQQFAQGVVLRQLPAIREGSQEMMFLTVPELRDLTGLVRPSAQYRWLPAQRLAAHADARTTAGYYAAVPRVKV